jgi:hypothetical protein
MIDLKNSTTKLDTLSNKSWAEKAYHVLDEENRGYLFASEILDHIKYAGVSTHQQL